MKWKHVSHIWEKGQVGTTVIVLKSSTAHQPIEIEFFFYFASILHYGLIHKN